MKSPPGSRRFIVSAVALSERLGDPGWVVVDCRFRLTEPEAGYRAYRAGHIPGARYAHLDDDLARKPAPGEGRHPLPDSDTFARTLSALGIGNDSEVVVYDDQAGAIAARLWWMLRWVGHDRVAVLDGGLKAWEAQSLPLSQDEPAVEPCDYVIERVRDDWVVSTAELEGFDPEHTMLFDARSEPRFRGESEPIDPVAGHVPGARNWPFDDNLSTSGCLSTPEEIAERFERHTRGSSPERVVAMCGSGVTACHLLWALESAGITDGRLYAGSWSEWIRDPARPIARDSD